MKKIILIVSLIYVMFFSALLTGCTDNQSVKKYGGTATIELPVDRKLVNITWKESNVWYCTRPMRKDEKPETYHFHEESNFGVWEGTYIIKESKTPDPNNYDTYEWSDADEGQYVPLNHLKKRK